MLLALALLLGSRLSAQIEESFPLEEEFLGKLIEIKLFDYATMQLAQMKATFPGKANELIFTEYNLALRQGRRADATALLKTIKPGNPLYTRALLTQVQLSQDNTEQLALLAEYFKNKKDLAQPADAEEFINAVSIQADLLLAAGKAREARASLDLLKKLPKTQEGEDRRLKFLTAEITLSLADDQRQQEAKLTEYKPFVDAALKDLNDLVYNPDFYASQAYGEISHAYILLREPDKALQTMTDAIEFLKGVEEALKKEGAMAHSPIARSLFYRGEAFFEKARLARDLRDKAAEGPDKDKHMAAMKEHLINAIKLFYKVSTDYEDSKFGKRAFEQFATIKEILENRFDVKIDLGGDREQKQKLEIAHGLFRQEKLAEALREYMTSLSLSPTGRLASEACFYAVVCYYKQEKFLEAMALADYMLDKFPEDERTDDALFNVGATMMKLGETLKKSGKEAESVTIMDEANLMFSKFVKFFPIDPRASRIAYRVAEYQYGQAARLRREAQEMQEKDAPAEQVRERTEAMRETFRQAVPLYEAITQNHGASEFGLKSYFKLGWVFHMLNDSLHASDNFLEYAKNQAEPIEDKVEAKFLAADHLMRANEPDDALVHFTELVGWLGAKDSKYPKTPKTDRYLANSQALIPWCHDARIRLLLAEIDKIRVQIEAMSVPTPDAPPAEEAAPAPEAPAEPAQDDDGTAAPAKEDAPPAPANGNGNGNGEPKPNVEPVVSAVVTVADLEAKIKELEAQLPALRQASIKAFADFVLTAPAEHDQLPTAMLKLGVLQIEAGDQDQSLKTFEDLQKRFPKSEAAETALFSLFKAQVDAKQMDRARDTARKLAGQLGGYGLASLAFIANGLFSETPRLTFESLDAELAMAANEEILKRARSATGPDKARLQAMQPRAHYQVARCLILLKRYADAAARCDTAVRDFPNNSFTWELYLLKGQALVDGDRVDEAVAALNQVLTGINKDKFEFQYNHAMLLLGRAIAKGNSKEAMRQGVARFYQLIEFNNLERSPELRPVIEAAYLEIARAYAALGDSASAEKYQAAYLHQFPQGLYRREISQLPPARF